MMQKLWKFASNSIRRPDGSYDPLQVFFAVATPVLVGLIVVLIYWYWFDTPKPLIVNEVRPLTTVVQPGGSFTYLFTGCIQTDVRPEVHRSWVDGIIFTMPPDFPIRLGQACYDDLQVSLAVPTALPSGTYHIDIEVIYEINPIRERVVSYTVGPIRAE